MIREELGQVDLVLDELMRHYTIRDFRKCKGEGRLSVESTLSIHNSVLVASHSGQSSNQIGLHEVP